MSCGPGLAELIRAGDARGILLHWARPEVRWAAEALEPIDGPPRIAERLRAIADAAAGEAERLARGGARVRARDRELFDGAVDAVRHMVDGLEEIERLGFGGGDAAHYLGIVLEAARLEMEDEG